MSDNILNEIIYFNNLEKTEKVNFICAKMVKIGIEYQLQKFDSPFGLGKNIVVPFIPQKTLPVTLLSAHYDGNSYFDNSGGVFALMQIVKTIYTEKPNKNYLIVFTDQEENYQQGSYYFLKNKNNLSIEKNINIDGFGIGDGIYFTDMVPIDKSSITILTDSNYFIYANVKSTSLFSSFQIEIEKSKNEDVYAIYKDYVEANYFIEKFDLNSYHKLIEKLWHYIYIQR